MRRSAIVLAFVALLGLVAPQPAIADSAALPATIDLPDGFFPEGITSGKGATVYVGSLVDGAIWRGNVRRGEGDVFVAGEAGRVAVGVDYDSRHARLWVAGGPTGTVTAYNARTGEELASYTAVAGFLNDLVVTRHAVYVTDSFLQQLVVVPLGKQGKLPPATAVRTLPLTGDISYVADEFNGNGIVATRGGRTLVLVQSETGQLFRVNPASGATDAINLHGATVAGGDGLELSERRLYVVQGFSNQVSVVRLGEHLRNGRVVSELTNADLDVPTTATLAADRLWAVNARFTTPRTPTTPYWITRLPRR